MLSAAKHSRILIAEIELKNNFSQLQQDLLESFSIVPIKSDRHQSKVSSSTMMLKILTALALISFIQAKYYLIETEGTKLFKVTKRPLHIF